MWSYIDDNNNDKQIFHAGKHIIYQYNVGLLQNAMLLIIQLSHTAYSKIYAYQ